MATKALRRWLPVVAAVLATLGSIPAARAANVALGKPAFADANYDTAGNVNNGNLGDAWTTAGSASAPNNFVGIDLQTATVIKQLKINWSEVATGFTVEVANTVDTDPNSFNFGIGDWTTAYFRNPTDPQPTGPDVIDLSSLAGTHRYIRIQGNASDSNNWGIAEWVVSDTLLPKVSGVAKFGTTPVANAIVTLTGPAGATSSVASVRTDATGAFSFTGLEAGAYTLSGAAPGQYAPVSQPVTVAAANVTQDLTFTTVVHNTTSRLPAYGLDFIASSTKVNDSNASSGFLALPADELPTGEAVWNTATPLPTGGLLGPTMPGTLNFFFPPTADGKDNVVNALGAILPLPAAHYTAVYVLQVGVEAPFYTRATLKYADGTEEPVLTSSGNDIYQFTTGSPGWGGGNEGEDEIVAFSVDKLYNGTTGGVNNEVPPFEVYMRTIRPNPAKVLTSINFNGEVSGTGSNTLSKGVILGYSADSLDTAQATGSVAGTIKAPNGTPVKGAQVTYFGYKIITDTTGTYKFFGVVPGDAVITASKPANYAPKSLTVPVTPGQNVTGADIQFVAPIPVVTDPLSAPSIDVVSTDANISDFTPTDWMLGREYIPTGVFSPDVPGINTESAATFTHDANAPTALAFDFGDIVDTPVAPGQPGYPVGGTPNAVVLHGATFLAPPAKIFNAYFAVVGAEGGTRIEATLHYQDGSTEKKILSISDWFQNPTTSELPYLLMHGRHTNGGEANQGGNIRLNALTLPVNATKQLSYVTFYESANPNTYPVVLAVSWETDAPQPASSDVRVTVKTSTGAAAAGAIVILGPYNLKADANGVIVFKGIPANLQLDIAAYLMGVTQQARITNHLVPVGKKLPSPDDVTITLPAAAPVFVQLPLYYDFDVFAAADMRGDFKGAPQNDWAWPSEAFPAPGTTVTVAGIPFKMPHTETNFNNVFRATNKTLKVVPGNYSSLDVVISGQGVGSAGRVYRADLNYADGTSEPVQFGVMDWVQTWSVPETANRRLFYRFVNPGVTNPFYSTTRVNFTGSQNLEVAFLPEPIPVNASKVLTSVTFVPFMRPEGVWGDDAAVLAATLEAVSAPATGTITGRVVGKPIGAAASGPIFQAQVVLDSGHAAYTDASGNFSIPNAPLGAGTLTVIPYGTGILTKTFPVTVAATTNAGDLNVGDGVSQVSMTLSSTTVQKGLSVTDNPVTPYGRAYPGAAMTPVTLAGQTGQQTNRLLVSVDPGWLWHGRLGNVGLDVASLSGATPVLAPHLYLLFEYFDNDTTTINVEYNKMELNNGSVRMTYADGGGIPVVKTGTNTWKTAVLDLDPATRPFGAYKANYLGSDFRFFMNSTTAVRNVVLSLNANPTLPPSSIDALRVAGGLAAADATIKASLDVNGDGVVTILDALRMQRP